MNTLELKSELHRLIDTTADVSILKAIKVILSRSVNKSEDWGEDVDEQLAEELQSSMEEADKGLLLSHEEALRQIKKKYNL